LLATSDFLPCFSKLFSDFHFWTFLKMSIFDFLKKLLENIFTFQ